MTDFFHSSEGNARNCMRLPPAARALDEIYDTRLKLSHARARTLREDLIRPSEKVLVVGVSVPTRPAALDSIVMRLKESRHQVEVSTVPMLPKGKFENVDDAIRAAPRPLADYDWLVVTDDDVDVKAGYLDDYLALARAADLAISQPAHKFHSYTTYRITRRRWGALVRETRFVEIGPITVFRADTFEHLVPFPPSRWAYGIDALWADLAGKHGWRMGIIDGAPVSHTRPVGATYDMAAAVEEGRTLLQQYGVTLGRAELFGMSRKLL